MNLRDRMLLNGGACEGSLVPTFHVNASFIASTSTVWDLLCCIAVGRWRCGMKRGASRASRSSCTTARDRTFRGGA